MVRYYLIFLTLAAETQLRGGSRMELQNLSGFRVDAIIENGRVAPVAFETETGVRPLLFPEAFHP